jgi:hypothetical protein
LLREPIVPAIAPYPVGVNDEILRNVRVLRIALVTRVQGSLASSTIGRKLPATLKRFEEALENTETSSKDRKRFQAEISANKQELEAPRG